MYMYMYIIHVLYNTRLAANRCVNLGADQLQPEQRCGPRSTARDPGMQISWACSRSRKCYTLPARSTCTVRVHVLYMYTYMYMYLQLAPEKLLYIAGQKYDASRG